MKRKKAPPPIKIQSQTRERPLSAIKVCSSLAPESVARSLSCATDPRRGEPAFSPRGRAVRLRHYDPQSPRCHPKLNRRLAGVLPIGIDVEGTLGFDLHRRGLCILHFAKIQMAAEINRRKEAEQFEFVHRADNAYIEFSVVQLGSRRDLHASAVTRRIGYRGEKRGLERSRSAIERELHGKGCEAYELARRAQRVTTTRA